jgi:hypothetical protein
MTMRSTFPSDEPPRREPELIHARDSRGKAVVIVFDDFDAPTVLRLLAPLIPATDHRTDHPVYESPVRTTVPVLTLAVA